MVIDTLALRFAVVALNAAEVELIETQGIVAKPVADRLWDIHKFP